MKEIKKTFMAGVLACAALNINDAKAEMSPFGYGLKVSASSSSAVSYTESAKIKNNKVENKLFGNLFVSADLYGEYAITNYIGFEGGAGYLKQGFKLEEVQPAGATGSKSTISLSTHGILVPIYLSIYPLGREEAEENGILKVKLGASGYFPFSSTYKQDEKELSGIANDKKAGFDIAATAALEYQLPCGLSIEARYAYDLLSRFPEKTTSQEILSGVSGLESLNTQYMTFGLGYNFASLLSE